MAPGPQAKKKTREELERELEFLKSRRLAEGWAAVLVTLIKVGGAGSIVYFGVFRSIQELAGRDTMANIALHVKANIQQGDPATLGVSLSWLLTLGAILYGLRQRTLRRDTVERLQERIRAREEALDPGRTSSTLTSRGETRKEDRI